MSGSFDRAFLRWNPIEVELPTNPESGLPILLTPKRFLRSLPELDAWNFWASPEAGQIRTDLNYQIASQVSKKEIVSIARRDPAAVDRWTKAREADEATAYDFDADREGVYGWLRQSRTYAEQQHLETAAGDAPGRHPVSVAITS